MRKAIRLKLASPVFLTLSGEAGKRIIEKTRRLGRELEQALMLIRAA